MRKDVRAELLQHLLLLRLLYALVFWHGEAGYLASKPAQGSETHPPDGKAGGFFAFRGFNGCEETEGEAVADGFSPLGAEILRPS